MLSVVGLARARGACVCVRVRSGKGPLQQQRQLASFLSLCQIISLLHLWVLVRLLSLNDNKTAERNRGNHGSPQKPTTNHKRKWMCQTLLAHTTRPNSSRSGSSLTPRVAVVASGFCRQCRRMATAGAGAGASATEAYQIRPPYKQKCVAGVPSVCMRPSSAVPLRVCVCVCVCVRFFCSFVSFFVALTWLFCGVVGCGAWLFMCVLSSDFPSR